MISVFSETLVYISLDFHFLFCNFDVHLNYTHILYIESLDFFNLTNVILNIIYF